ncbi:MFS transporter [Stella sp.]|uniref:MFS transporter n=1 Tax=Stella sp. TaxID=2912054 RepID=UPI0035B46CC2
MTVPAAHRPPASRAALVAWSLYDFANSAFPTVVVTFVFSAYFVRGVAADVETGTAAWGHAMALAGIATAVLGPVLGAVADRSGRRKPWILAFSLACILAGGALWYVRPDPSYVPLALALAVVAVIAFEVATVFYNAMLPDLVPPGRIGRWSGWAWGVGYLGGLLCLVVALFGLVMAPQPLFGLDKATSEHVRAAAPLTAIWFAVFALPFFVLTPDRPATGVAPVAAARAGLAQIGRTLRHLGGERNVARFLVSRLFYTDALNTLFAFGGIYAAGTFGMSFEEVILFGIALNVTAGLGAAAFAWIDDWVGPKTTILAAIAGLMTAGTAVLLVDDKAWFWVFGLALGVFVGPAQAASRSLMAHLAPPERESEMFGLFALSGKATSFVGPAALAWTTLAFGSQRAGMATIIVFFAIGFAILLGVDGRRRV